MSGPVVLYDGSCGVCDRTVRFILDHEREPRLRFAPLQSSAATRLLAEIGEGPGDLSSIVLLEDDRGYRESTAVVRLSRYLRPPWRWLGLLRLVPRPVRDMVYRMVARRRHRLGRCLMPAAPIAGERLLSDEE